MELVFKKEKVCANRNREFKIVKLCLHKIIKTYYLFSSAFITDGSVKFSPTPLYVYIKKTIYIIKLM